MPADATVDADTFEPGAQRQGMLTVIEDGGSMIHVRVSAEGYSQRFWVPRSIFKIPPPDQQGHAMK